MKRKGFFTFVIKCKHERVTGPGPAKQVSSAPAAGSGSRPQLHGPSLGTAKCCVWLSAAKICFLDADKYQESTGGSFSFSAARRWCTKTVPEAARGLGSLRHRAPPCSQPASPSSSSTNPDFAASPRWADGGCEGRVRLRGKMNEFGSAGRSGGPSVLPSPGGDPKVLLCPGLAVIAAWV